MISFNVCVNESEKMPVHKEEIKLKRKPLFPKPTTNVSPTDYLRNFWCNHYDACLEEAANRKSYLSCSLCGFKTVYIHDELYPSGNAHLHEPNL